VPHLNISAAPLTNIESSANSPAPTIKPCETRG
jgi:hypothetical protein